MVMVQIAASQLRPEMTALIHEQPLIAINRGNAGDRFRWFAVCPLREPVVPAQFIQFSVLSSHVNSIIHRPNTRKGRFMPIVYVGIYLAKTVFDVDGVDVVWPPRRFLSRYRRDELVENGDAFV